MAENAKTVYSEKAVLVAVDDGSVPGRGDPLEELASLAETAGAVVRHKIVQRRNRPDARTYIGEGKVGEISEIAAAEKIDVVIFEDELSPAQVRNLEKDLKIRVIDRTALILDIFATHARTRQAKLQVEIAQLEYLLPRLQRSRSYLGQQAGGMAGGGSIGVRGPGEMKVEVDRRLARRHVFELKKELAEIEKRKQREVSARALDSYTVSLVGYTNAGKSTLMNALTKAGVLAEDKLFSTLDTRTRLWKLGRGAKVLLSDTVGFIRKLPHGLVSSFHATLEEVLQADLLLHVVDASHPECASQIAAVEDVLQQLGAKEKETLLVFNKIDRLRDAVELSILANRHPGSVAISAGGGAGLDALEARVFASLSERLLECELRIPHREGKLIAELGAHAVLLERDSDDEGVRLRLRVPRRLAWKVEPYRVAAERP